MQPQYMTTYAKFVVQIVLPTSPEVPTCQRLCDYGGGKSRSDRTKLCCQVGQEQPPLKKRSRGVGATQYNELVTTRSDGPNTSYLLDNAKGL